LFSVAGKKSYSGAITRSTAIFPIAFFHHPFILYSMKYTETELGLTPATKKMLENKDQMPTFESRWDYSPKVILFMPLTKNNKFAIM
jgi:hypothetical protein